MGAGKSALLLQTVFNYEERGMRCLLLTADLDDRYDIAQITSRIGISRPAETFKPGEDLRARHLNRAAREGVAAVLCDEAQFLTRGMVSDLASFVDRENIPVMAYGLRTDFRGYTFEGSAALLALADELREIRTICHCGRKATMILRRDSEGRPVTAGPQIEIGGSERYESVCRRHWSTALAAAQDVTAAADPYPCAAKPTAD